MIGCTPLAMQASLNGIARIEAVAVGQRDRREAQHGRPLGDRLRLHRPFEHGEGRENAQRNVGLSHSATMGISAVDETLGRSLIHDLSRLLPAAFHDVADLAHAAGVGVGRCSCGSGSGRERRGSGRAFAGGAAAVRVDAAQCARRYCAAMLRSSAARPASRADRGLAPSPGIGAVEARPCADRAARAAEVRPGLPAAAATAGPPARPRSVVSGCCGAGCGDPRQRRQRRDDRVGVAQQDHVAAAVGRRLERIIDVGRQASGARRRPRRRAAGRATASPSN